VTVTNAAPSADAGADVTSAEGSTVSLPPATFHDQGTADTHTATVNWGDGSPAATGTVAETPSGPPGKLTGADGTITADHVYADNGTYTITVCVTDDDAASHCDTSQATISNVMPTVDAGADQSANEGTTVSLAPSTFHDQGTADTHTATIDWGDGSPIATGAVTQTPSGPPGSTSGQDGTIGGSHVYADNGTYTVQVCVRDDDDAAACNTLSISVANVAPTVDAGADRTIDESDVLSLAPSTFNDKGTLDSHTATVSWGDGAPTATGLVTESPHGPPGSTAGANGSVDAQHAYGDNSTYTLTVCVKDDDGAQTCDTLQVTVNNVAPTLTLSSDGSILFGDGRAFLGRAGVSQSHSASAGDVGSDDLTFLWEFAGPAAQTHAHFNDGLGPDPTPSSLGTFPFAATDPADVTFAAPGVYVVKVTVTDDDGASVSRQLPKLIVEAAGAGDPRPRGWWQSRYGPAGADAEAPPKLTAEQRSAYVTFARFASAVFGQQVPLGSPEDAYTVLHKLASGDSHRAAAQAEVLAAWLNFARGAVGWGEVISVPSMGSFPFNVLIARAEAILLDAGASKSKLQDAHKLALAVN
jgi:hypothetical protein